MPYCSRVRCASSKRLPAGGTHTCAGTACGTACGTHQAVHMHAGAVSVHQDTMYAYSLYPDTMVVGPIRTTELPGWALHVMPDGLQIIELLWPPPLHTDWRKRYNNTSRLVAALAGRTCVRQALQCRQDASHVPDHIAQLLNTHLGADLRP